MQIKKYSNSGFAILEAVIALGILAFILGANATFLQQLFKLSGGKDVDYSKLLESDRLTIQNLISKGCAYYSNGTALILECAGTPGYPSLTAYANDLR